VIVLNCLISENNILDLAIKTVKLKGIKDIRDFFRNYLDKLSKEGIAEAYPYANYLYFVGDESEVIQELKDFINGNVLSCQLDLNIRDHRNILAYLFYRSFIRKLINIGYVPLKKVHKRRKAIPTERLNSLIEILDEKMNIYVCYGLKFKIDFLKDGKSLLFIDLYSPPCFKLGNLFFPIKLPGGNKLYEEYKKKSILPSIERYRKLEQIIELLKGDEGKISVIFSDGQEISFSPELIQPGSLNNYFSVNEVTEPSIEFKNCNSRNPIYGIAKCKPYTYLQEIFTNLILIVDDKVNNVQINNFLNMFINGCSDRYGYYEGYSSLYGASLKVISIEYISINSADDIKRKIDSLHYSEDEKPILIVIIRDEIAPKGTKEGSAFYREIKSFCIKKRLRLQLIRESTLGKLNENGRTLIMFNIANALYAKSGGVPWKIRDVAYPGSAVIGMGFTIDHHRKEIKAGTLYVFDRLGRHLYLETRRYTLPLTEGLYIPYDIMKSMLEEIKERIQWIRYMIFHKTAPYHDDEKRSINEVLGKKIKYTLLYLKTNTPIRVFNLNFKNNLSPLRGQYIERKGTYENSFILCTTGNSLLDTRIRMRPLIFGTPRPIEVLIEENLIEGFEINKIAEHLILLTKLDWNTTNIEVREPITIKYARRAAMLLPIYEEDYASMISDIRDLM